MDLYELDPQIRCAVLAIADGQNPDWAAADAHLTDGGRADLAADLADLRDGLSSDAYYNLLAVTLPAGPAWVAAKVDAEPDEHDAAAFFSILRLHDAGALTAAGFAVSVA